jgi:bla regulator protein BlaR1
VAKELSMILQVDGHPSGRRYSVGFVGSVLLHVVLVAVVLSQAGATRPALPDAHGRSGRYAAPRVSAPSQVEPGSWAVRQVKLFELRLAIANVVDHVWQSTLFAIVIGLLTLAFRRKRARVRYALWFIASLKFLAPVSLIMWMGGGSLVGQWLTVSMASALWPAALTMPQVATAWGTLALVVVWTVGFFAIVGRRFKLSRDVWDVALTSRRVELLDVKTPARLQVGLADGLLEPGVIGWVNPVLLLPADIERHLTRQELEAIVAHQLCHVRRFDNMTAAIHMLVEAIFWFYPLVWWLGARLAAERQRACDEHVLGSVGASGPYARGILTVSERYVKSPLASVSSVGRVNVRQRIDAILAHRPG